ncbi:phosphate acetyltransferase [Beutenbergia cavernae DSM 12333]|uniref:Phosphate acetyltransferase n=1 Tax=Beutenbergia cavernae (strain ATCC BAA-8 / DSM 12333 / CCUG 43141 / JCM 11478 / NBRC 16432 / NCIMB 13614 / HKI 0122) TaxID=471853 RepID=C5BZW2_BEUC1|nr:phosphate acetyltransferase [Beutenbergia cavernae]ACQ81292.1 phosphate acetyltransferase [Beutenbergia cavernae DSM 12333]
MSRNFYVTSPEGHTGKSAIALGLLDLFVRRVSRVGVFRPVIRGGGQRDTVLELLLAHDGVDLTYDECVGVTYDEVHADPDAALDTIVTRFRQVDARCEVVVVVGSDYTDVVGPTELSFNARVAANLGAAVVLVVRALDRTPDDVRQVVDVSVAEIRSRHAAVGAVVVNRSAEADMDDVRAALMSVGPVWVLPDTPLLAAPSVRDLMTALDGSLRSGDEQLLDREAEHIVVGAMGIDHLLDRIVEGSVVITPADRSDAILALMSAHAADGFPTLAAIVLNGGFEPSAQVGRLVEGLGQRLPVVTTQLGTFAAASAAAGVRGLLSTGSQRKIDVARSLFETHVDGDAIVSALDLPATDVVTPLMFEHTLIERARSHRRHIVLPEGGDDRILRAASTLLARGVADLTILGVESAVRSRAAELGLDIEAADVLDPATSDLLEEFAAEYARVRAHKGMTPDRAREIVSDVSYFGTLMVHTKRADGMVSGAQHTTAHTIKPSFEIIKTAPGVDIVSSCFFMCLADRVLVYADCAVNPDPDATQLADIAISSADTAQQFGVSPLIAMLSYSTGESGTGAEVDKVRSATGLVRERAPQLVVEGPIQYDAAVDAGVAASKMPGSAVAGQATVLIFPDLNTGNNTYKAVQRSAGAVAVGPVLQGLAKPVNDLSRGATVKDIVNTVAITAIQAQAAEGAADRGSDESSGGSA